MNGKEFKWKQVFLNPANVKSLDVASSKIFFETKEKDWKYRSLSDLIKTLHNYQQIISDSITPIFIIQGIIIDDPDSIKIDYTYFANAILKPLSTVKQINGECKKLVLIDIDLSDTPKKWVRIRGDYPELKLYKNK